MAITAMMLFISMDTAIRLTREAEKNDIRSAMDRNVYYATEMIKRNLKQLNVKDISACGTLNDVVNANSCLKLGNTKYIFLDKNSGSIVVGTGSIQATSFVGTKNVLIGGIDSNVTPVDSSVNLDRASGYVDIKSLEFDFNSSTGFVGIVLRYTDKNNVVYSNDKPATVATGVIVRN